MILKIKKFSFLILSLMIISCGFQLRGSIDVDFKTILISGGSQGLNKHIEKRFNQNGIKVNSKDPEKILEIISDKLDKRILSLSSSGSVKEYELIYKVSYRFKSSNGPWSKNILKEVVRDYTYDDNDRVAKELEEKNLIQGMRDDIVRSIVSQISVSD